MLWLRFPHPEPRRQRQRILPVFLPYHGCPHRCAYCAQHLQTGVGSPDLSGVLAEMTRQLAGNERSGTRNLGVAFYGGTFTALPETWQRRFLTAIRPYRLSGMVAHVRCSTRPDRIDLNHLRWLQDLGMNMVELGVQSFDRKVLQESERGYDPDAAVSACRLVRESGLKLGIQLMPGLPGSTIQGWLFDVMRTCSLRPEAVRIYPCLVLADTVLARQFLAGSYRPWSLSFSIWAVSQALLHFWKHEIPVIRIGLAPERELFKAILGGPWHPSFGHSAKSHALRAHILRRRAHLPEGTWRFHIPKRYAAEFWGHGREHSTTWIRHGLSSDIRN